MIILSNFNVVCSTSQCGVGLLLKKRCKCVLRLSHPKLSLDKEKSTGVLTRLQTESPRRTTRESQSKELIKRGTGSGKRRKDSVPLVQALKRDRGIFTGSKLLLY